MYVKTYKRMLFQHVFLNYYATWKSKLNMILVITDLRFVFMEKCPPFPTQNASQSVKDAYDRWTKANDKARPYILASMFDILSKKREIMVTARQSVRELVLNMIFNFNVAQINAVVFDEKSQETSSFKQLEESEMTLKVGTGDVISACAVGDANGRVVSQPNHYLGLTETQVVIPGDGVEEALFYKQAMNDVDKDQWVKAMDLEMESMYFNSVWKLVDLLEWVKPIGCKWIYEERFSWEATFYDYGIWQMDVKTAFLNGNLEKSIFMSQPEGFITQGQEEKVCKLNRSIYRLKQASRSWKIRFDTAIKSYGFDQNVDEPCVYKKINKGKVAFLVLYGDDILLIGNDMGYLTDNSKKGLLPFRHGVHLSKEQCPKKPQEVEDMRRIPYASTVDSLMYVMLYTRPDTCYAVGIVSRKSTWGSVFTLNGGAVVWRSIEQGCIADSTIGTVANSKEPHSHKRGKHIERKHHLIQEIMQREDVIVTKIASKHNIADPFTKTLTSKVSEGYLECLGLRDMYIR
ncbi:gag/pol protein [Cucumis melo var. makuwa]|uniref:Gag/pol protein n=1 Tax=Cucumis melo var. makuwa TaxID=1194695 RepID=A0A5D3DTU5_CUCMM|nr:gag/pol protein [Cucumis melo var. makuwa]